MFSIEILPSTWVYCDNVKIHVRRPYSKCNVYSYRYTVSQFKMDMQTYNCMLYIAKACMVCDPLPSCGMAFIAR